MSVYLAILFNDTNSFSTSISNLNTSVSNVISSVAAMSTATSGSTYNPFSYSKNKPRMKNLGTISSTVDCANFMTKHKINTGEFEDLELGDILYIVHDPLISTVSSSTISSWFVAGFDHYFRYSSTQSIEIATVKHHICLWPTSTLLRTAYLYSTAQATKGYYGSQLADQCGSTLMQKFNSRYKTDTMTYGPKYFLRCPIYATTYASSYGASMLGAGHTGYSALNRAYGEQYFRGVALSEVELTGQDINSSSIYDNYLSKKLPLFEHIPWYEWYIKQPYKEESAYTTSYYEDFTTRSIAHWKDNGANFSAFAPVYASSKSIIPGGRSAWPDTTSSGYSEGVRPMIFFGAGSYGTY